MLNIGNLNKLHNLYMIRIPIPLRIIGRLACPILTPMQGQIRSYGYTMGDTSIYAKPIELIGKNYSIPAVQQL